MPTITGWSIIHSKNGLYTGWWRSKREAKTYHADALGKSWEECRRFGDKAVKVLISYHL